MYKSMKLIKCLVISMQNKTKQNKYPSPTHIILKVSKVNNEEIVVKAAGRKKIVTYKGTPIRLLQIPQQKRFGLEEHGMT